MPDEIEKKKIWVAYSCPLCRFVFRVSKDRNGPGVICPGCKYLLKVSLDEDRRFKVNRSESIEELDIELDRNKKDSPILAREITEEDTLVTPDKLSEKDTSFEKIRTQAQGKGRRYRRRKKSMLETPSWESEDTSVETGKSTWLLVTAGVIGLAVIAAIVWLVRNPTKSKKIVLDPSEIALLSKEAKDIENKVKANSEVEKKNIKLQEDANIRLDFIKESKKVINAFLNAEKESDIYSLVRNPKEVVPKIKEWYTEERPWKPLGVRKISGSLELSDKMLMGIIKVKLGDYSDRSMVIERTSEGYLLDWESWVAWSSMPWQDLYKKKPSERVLVRAVCSLGNYYNRDFNDEKKWVVITMNHPSDDKVLYGYIDAKQPDFEGLLEDLNHGKARYWTLAIRYPKDAKSNNQVLVEEAIQKGWIDFPKGALKK